MNTTYCAFFRNCGRVAVGAVWLLVGFIGTLPADAQEVAATPVMAWSSWNYYTCKVNDAVVRAEADALVSTNMKAAGYNYVIVDDCWQGERDAAGMLHPNSKFPDMKALADYVHGKGLKFGIYSSPGPKTCAGFEGSLGHEAQDAATFAQWGVDWLKYDLCTFKGSAAEQIAAYKKMHDALEKTGRKVVYALCQYGNDRVWTWGARVGGNQWRTSRDISDNYDRMSLNGFGENGLEKFAGPGHWNDPDMLEVGNGGMSHDEYITHMSLWCILAAPLLAGNNLTRMTAETLEILTNREIIALDQDPLGVQGHRLSQEGPLEVWIKPLADHSTAVAFFNRGETTTPITVSFADLGLTGAVSVRDLWAGNDLGVFREAFTRNVPSHGAVILKVRPEISQGGR
jgi:alpha-galactosidase